MTVRLGTEDSECYRELLDKYDTWMFDCDGVLWHGDGPIDGAAEVLRILRNQSM
jgi:4-nitrophenyl phosphatase